MPIVVLLAVVWVAVIGSWALDNRRTRRPDNSVASFRAQLSTLERATPGTSLNSQFASSGPGRHFDVRRRRRDVLVGLLGATGFSALLAMTVGGAFPTLLLLVSGGCLGAYVYALRQLKLRSVERAAKVRPLVPRTAPATAPPLVLRRAGSN